MSVPPKAERATDPRIADMSGDHALPRRSGEIVFHHDWERRAFAMAVALCEQEVLEWDEFRARLVASIASADDGGRPTAPGYFEHWLSALEKVLREDGLATDGSPRSGSRDS